MLQSSTRPFQNASRGRTGRQAGAAGQGRAASALLARATPSNAGEVVSWAQQQFLQEVSRDKPDSSINLAKVCMLLALEEEAASQLQSAPATSARTSATASTWGLNRLDALAAEVVDNIMALDDDEPQHTPSKPQPDTQAAATGSAPSSNQPSTGPGSLDASSSSSSSSQAARDPEQQQQQQQATAAAFAAVRQQAQRYPMQVLNAVNAVLFRRHGYSACNRFGASVDSQLSAVMEDGPGSVAALTILYLEVCSRLGLDCGVKVVEEGRYCLVWPRPQQQQQPSQVQQAEQQQQQQQTLLSVGGDACVVDVYGEGALLPVREATELFGITQQELFAGSSRRELLAALLSELQSAHWCAAVGCSPAPALMTPLTASTAVGHAVRQLHGASIERAAAAAAKRVVLLPREPRAQLDLALLCYFSGRYEDAWLELGSYLEQLRAVEQQQQQQQQQEPLAGRSQEAAAQPSEPVAPGTASSSSTAGSTSSNTTTITTSSSSSRVSELHAAIQSMLIGGEVVPEVPPAASLTAAEAALASAEEGGVERKARLTQERELRDILLLFQKLQLELTVAANRQG